LTRYNEDADAWDSVKPSNDWLLRRLLIAYMANKTVNPAKAAVYLNKIQALANLGGVWGPLLYGVDDGVATGANTVTSANADFTAGCGGSCTGYVLAVNGIGYRIVSATAHTLTVPEGVTISSGNNLKLRITNDGTGRGAAIALIYDWLYNDLDPAIKTELMNQLDALCKSWEASYVNFGASPYNSVVYINGTPFGLMGALAIYPDHPNGLARLKFAMDVWFNRMLPVWRQVLGPEGGVWHEHWNSYVNRPNGLTAWLVASLLTWQTATGDPIFTRESWLRNFGYATIYMTRPDMVMEAYGDVSDPYLNGEDFQGSLNGLAEIYDDPVLRGWSRMLNGRVDDFEPSAWPFYAPDKSTNTNVAPLSTLPKMRNMTGWGSLTARTGWTEDDTAVTLRYGDNFWSHQHSDVGAFTIFSRGNLAIDSGSYASGYNATHHANYARQTIAHNTLTVLDPSDYYPNVQYPVGDQAHAGVYLAPSINDGGQRQVGSRYNNIPQTISPDTIGDWLRNWDYFHMGKMVGLASTANYTYTAVDITAAYKNKFSSSTPNVIQNRTDRVQKVVRHMLFIPSGTSAYVVVFDQVTSTSATFTKKWLLHSVNQPTVSGNRFEIVRSELAAALPYPDLWPQKFRNQLKYDTDDFKYKYDGKLYGWTVLPQSASIGIVGGPGKEFYVEDPLNPSSGTNWNQCAQGLCPAGWGLGAAAGYINPVSATSPREPGSWRLEVKPTTPATHDLFLHVMLATTTDDANVPVNVTVPSNLPAGAVGATWTSGGKTYTITFPQDGVGGHITITGAGGVDEDVLQFAQRLPDHIQIVSGNGQTAASGSALASPLAVVVRDRAGVPVPDSVVHWGISQGNARVEMGISKTNAQGVATTILTLGQNTAGSAVKVMANVNGVTPVEFSFTVAGAGLTLTSMTCTPASLSSGATSTCTATLSEPAGPGGAAVTLASNSSLVTLPASVAIPPESSSSTFTAIAGSIPAGATVVITATLNGVSQTASLILTPPAGSVLSSASCAPSNLSSGSTSTCTVTLSQAAGSGGATVSLSSSTALLTVPATVTIPAGSNSVAFTASAGVVTTGVNAIVTATFGGTAHTVSLVLVQPSSGGIPISNGAWTMIPTKGLPVQSVGYEKLVYAPAPIKKAMMLGNYLGIGSEPNESLLAYDFETNAWSVLDKGARFHSEYMPEGGHPSGDFAYDPNRKVLMYLCCGSASQQAENLKLMWWYDPIGQSGRSKPTPLKPPIALLSGSSFNALTDTYVLHGGTSFLGTWTYNPVTSEFQKQTTGGTPPDPSVLSPAVTYNTDDQRVYLFGGVNPAAYSNDLFAYDGASNTWSKLNPTGPLPAPRARAGFAYDSTNKVFMLYGGLDDSKTYNDTWIYNPATNAWNQLTLPQSPPLGAAAPFEMLTYDSDHNVFILVLSGTGGYADFQWGHYALQTWLFRYAGTGPNAGFAQPNVSITPGAVNRNGGWAKEATLAASGSALYAGWVETGRPSDATDGKWLHVFTSQYRSGGWSALGSTSTSIDSEYGGFTDSHAPSLAVIGGAPWVSWYKWNNGSAPLSLWVKRWNIASGGWEGEKVGVVGPNGGGKTYTGNWSGSIAYKAGDVVTYQGLAWYLALHANTDVTPGANYFSSPPTATVGQGFEFLDASAPGICSGGGRAKAVCRWSGSTWQAVPDLASTDVWQFLPSYAGPSKLADVGGTPHVAFLESQAREQSVLVYVKYWDGTRWQLRGNSPLNVNALGNTIATSVSMTSDGTVPYVAWTEYRPTYGANVTLGPARVYVAHWDSGNNQWQMVGNGINLNPNDNAEYASIAWLNGQPYVAWTEKSTAGNNQLYVKTLVSGNWVLVGSGSLNRDTNTGWSYKPSLVADSTADALYLGWVEQRAIGERAQSHVLRYSGGSWTALGTSLNADVTLGSAQGISLAVLSGQPVAAWAEVNPGSVRQMFVKQWDGSSWKLLTGTAGSACDINQDGVVSTLDVDAAAKQALGTLPCNTADLQQTGVCSVVGVQRVVNAVLGGECKVGN
jgi:hypothetical protein